MEHEDAMTPKAAEAFAQYIGMGPGRSLRALASVLVEQGYYKSSATALSMLNRWSVEHRWQERIAVAVTAKTEEALAKASEIDAQGFLRTSEMVAERLSSASALHLDAILKIREAVRKPEPRGGATVNVGVSVALRSAVERIAAEQGLDVEDVLAEAERILEEGAG